jgi:hypothetical protein
VLLNITSRYALMTVVQALWKAGMFPLPTPANEAWKAEVTKACIQTAMEARFHPDREPDMHDLLVGTDALPLQQWIAMGVQMCIGSWWGIDLDIAGVLVELRARLQAADPERAARARQKLTPYLTTLLEEVAIADRLVCGHGTQSDLDQLATTTGIQRARTESRRTQMRKAIDAAEAAPTSLDIGATRWGVECAPQELVLFANSAAGSRDPAGAITPSEGPLAAVGIEGTTVTREAVLIKPLESMAPPPGPPPGPLPGPPPGAPPGAPTGSPIGRGNSCRRANAKVNAANGVTPRGDHCRHRAHRNYCGSMQDIHHPGGDRANDTTYFVPD